MQLQHRSISLALSLSALLAPARAVFAQSLMATQIPPQTAQGHFSAWPLGLSTASTGPSPVTGTLLVRAPNAQPAAWTEQQFGVATVTHPDYSLAALTANWLPGFPPLTPVFGGTSTGGDVTPRVSTSGALIMDDTNWYALNISVKQCEDPVHCVQGEPGSLINGRFTSVGTASGDVFSFYPWKIAGINPAFADTVRIEYTREQLGIASDLRDFDFGMGVISVDPMNRAGSIVPVRNRFYFTLSSAWIQATPWLTALDGQPVLPSTIYKMTWDGTSWSAPAIAYSHQELFPNRDPGSVEIDAISVYQLGQTSEAEQDRVVFSLTLASDPLGGPPYDQLLVYQRAHGTLGSAGAAEACGTTALMTTTANGPAHVSDRLGLRRTTSGEPDDVDGTCGLDPHLIDPNAPTVLPVLGIAEATSPHGDGKLGLTAVRTTLPDPTYNGPIATAPTIDVLHLQVSGLDLASYPIGLVGIYLEPAGSNGGDPVPDEAQLLGSPILVDAVTSKFNVVNSFGEVPSVISGSTPLRMSARIFGVSLNPFAVVQLRESWFLSVRY